MECDSGFRRLASHNRFVGDLERQGYQLDFIGAHLVIFGVPYLDLAGALCYGDLASPVDLKADYEIDTPKSHQVWFNGQPPYGTNGQLLRISAVSNPRQITETLTCQLSFSLKIDNQPYPTFESKIRTYLDVLTGPAREKYGAIPQSILRARAAELPSPLRFPDTLSARDGVNDLAARLMGLRVGIVGAGGTASYILDYLSKTHIKVIRIYDDDIVHLHTLFRVPGALDDRALGEKKVDLLYKIYSVFHAGIEPHAIRIVPDNVDLLVDLDFVFIAVDDGPSRDLIARHLANANVRFADTGMGLYRASGALDGMLRVSGGDATDAARLFGTPYLPSANPADNEYRQQPQISELNALAAALAVIRFKQTMGVFAREATARANIFEIGTFDLDHYERNEV